MEPALLFFAAVLLVAYFTQAVIGFGAMIFALTLGALVYPVDYLIPVLLPVGVAAVAFLAVRDRAAVDRRLLVRRILPLTALGMPIGFALLVYAPLSLISRAYGLAVVAFSVWQLVGILRATPNAGVDAPLAPPRSPAWLVAGGVMQGLVVSGGPLIVLYTAGKLSDRSAFRGTMSCTWTALNIALVIAHAVRGTLNGQTLLHSALLLPLMVVGIAAGEWVHTRISQRAFRVAVFALLIVAGFVLIAKG